MKLHLRRIFIILFVSFILININFVYGNNNDVLSLIENNIYGFDYNNDSKQNRINRLEKTIYGKNFSGDINKRITKLSADISADVIGLEIPASKDTFLADEYSMEDDSVDYPIINEIESKIFGKTYKNRDFHSRIVAIEKKLFGKIYDVDDYSTRMDRIKATLYPQNIAQQNLLNDDSSYYNDRIINDMNFSHYDNADMPYGQKNYTRQYSNYGDNNFDNSIYNNNELNSNLAQMEREMFGTEFSNEDAQSRIKRLNSVNKAKKSFPKYDSQKFSQHMSTAMQIGAMILMILAMVL